MDARGAERVLSGWARLGLARALDLRARLSSRPVAAAIVYHRLVPGEEPWHETRPNLTLGVEQFERHLRELASLYRLVAADELLVAARDRGRGARIPIAITFDDDYVSHLELAAPALARHDAPATFFICGASLTRPHGFWWQRIARAIDSGALSLTRLRELVPRRAGEGPDDRNLRQVGGDVEWMSFAERERFSDSLLALAGPDPPGGGMTAAQVAELAGSGFEIGFHTRRHPNLSTLDDDAVVAAVSDGRAEVEAAAGRPIRQFAYPGGKATDAVIAATRDAGYQLAFLSDGGPIPAETDPFEMRRPDPAWCREPGSPRSGWRA